MSSGLDRYAPSQPGVSRLIWVYLALTICEGALRRWILPGLAGPLLLVRDPVALAILIAAFRARLLIRAPLFWFGIGLGCASFVLTLMLGHRNVVTAVYGLRILILHFPLILIIGRVWSLDTVAKAGRGLLIVAIPMTVLIGAQFFLPQSHLVNIGIGGEGTAGFGATAERFRPPGTFSFTLGVTQFYSLVGAFIAGFAMLGRRGRRWWWASAVVALCLATPLSISRGLVFQLAVTALFLFVGAARNPRQFPRIVGAVVLITILFYGATFIPAFAEASDAFMERWSSANDEEGGVEGVFVDRLLDGLLGALFGAHDIPLFGFGLGIGTNAGAHLLTGERAFLVGEGEWFRLVGEMGPILGVGLIGVRIALAASLLVFGLRGWRHGNPFPLVLSSVASIWVAQGNWAQPTSLGFVVVASGMALASCRVRTANGVLKRSESSVVANPSMSTDVV